MCETHLACHLWWPRKGGNAHQELALCQKSCCVLPRPHLPSRRRTKIVCPARTCARNLSKLPTRQDGRAVSIYVMCGRVYYCACMHACVRACVSEWVSEWVYLKCMQVQTCNFWKTASRTSAVACFARWCPTFEVFNSASEGWRFKNSLT